MGSRCVCGGGGSVYVEWGRCVWGVRVYGKYVCIGSGLEGVGSVYGEWGRCVWEVGVFGVGGGRCVWGVG